MIQTYLIRKNQMMTSQWSGGTTTQIDIFPDGAVYADRNFVFRVSSATIEESPSQFTALPGYQRWITMLSGPVVLEHTLVSAPEDTLSCAFVDPEKIELSRQQVYSFDGGTPTKSFGEARDFNLMLRKGLFGKMMTLAAGPKVNPQWIRSWLSDRSAETQGHLAVYWPEDPSGVQGAEGSSLRIVSEKNTILLNRGDYLRLSGTVKALADVELGLDVECGILLLYMET